MHGLPRNGTIHGAGVDVFVSEPLGHRARQRSLPRPRRAINGNDQPLHKRFSVPSSVPLKRRAYAAILVALLASVAVVSLPYLDAVGFIIRAADLPGTPATVAAWRASAFTRDPEIAVPTRAGNVPGRYYRPALRTRRTVVLIPGVHRDGINESRLVGLAEELAATGYGVLTVAAPDLQKFKITPQVTDVIEDAVRWTGEQMQFRTDGKIGVIGISF